ncbi:hypothetical protein Ahy_B10g101964 [Arachis hypogaea]|uniref:CCHC-type domain-containing protein n=1 Tax=Arachis hypogaea TaxID=3818 RepID=A0A444X0V5_ARAHY|nr:hypothetical protein Ahy_B10g101964 [Arachis hypogaea]
MTPSSLKVINGELFELVIHREFYLRFIAKIISMPCKHEVAAMAKIGLKAEDFVHKWLTMDVITTTYANCIKLVNALRLLPPTIKRATHRSKLKKRADPIERELNTTKVKKIFIATCSKCGQKGHYYKTCTNAPQDPN